MHEPLTAPKTYAGDTEAFANSRSLRESYFILQMPRNIVSLFKRFGRRVFQNRTSSSCQTLPAIAATDNMTNKFIIGLLLTIGLTSCEEKESDEAKIARAEKECQKKTNIDGLRVYFFGYFQSDADSLDIKIKHGDKIIENYIDKIPEVVEDSIRHLRHYDIDRKILITDTLILKIKSEPEKKLYGFKYFVRPHFTMFDSDWGCDFYELTADVIEGGTADFKKKGWNFLNKQDFKSYYYK
jgi:hypothetical protein